MIDPAKGELRAQRVDNRSGIAGPRRRCRRRPSRSPRSAATRRSPSVSTAASTPCRPSKGVITVLRPEGTGFAKPVTTKLGFTSKSAQVTAVGTHWVVWDSGTGKLYSDTARAAPAALGRRRRARQPGLRGAAAAGTGRDARCSSRTSPS